MGDLPSSLLSFFSTSIDCSYTAWKPPARRHALTSKFTDHKSSTANFGSASRSIAATSVAAVEVGPSIAKMTCAIGHERTSCATVWLRCKPSTSVATSVFDETTRRMPAATATHSSSNLGRSPRSSSSASDGAVRFWRSARSSSFWSSSSTSSASAASASLDAIDSMSMSTTTSSSSSPSLSPPSASVVSIFSKPLVTAPSPLRAGARRARPYAQLTALAASCLLAAGELSG
mmetsp:Transcript_8111/g.25030  ORF Transcript_8111/g.25030 Transcript_8111/m.25030 type:complete len:232 (+) Transcript_8111:323-1018(+)